MKNYKYKRDEFLKCVSKSYGHNVLAFFNVKIIFY